MSWSIPDRDLTAAIERRLREALRDPALAPAGVVGIDAVRVDAPPDASADRVAERVSAAIVDNLRGGGRR
jgi:hypothetical protein